MNSASIEYQVIDWNKVEKTQHKGESGVACWKILQFPGLRIRIVEHSESYLTGHWCAKGRIVHCLEKVTSIK